MSKLDQWKQAAKSWHDPNQICVETIDAHTAGQPLRIFIDGFPLPEGQNILARRRDAQSRLESYRTGTMWEPRGHADMYGCIIVPPERETSDFGVLFVHNEGYSSMCGHGIIAVAKIAVQVGWVESDSNPTNINIDAPAGLIKAQVHFNDDRQITGVSFCNVESFVDSLDCIVDVHGLGQVKYDLAYGGAYYAFVDADQIQLELKPNNQPQIVDIGRRIKQAIIKSKEINHPLHDDLSFLYGTIFTGQPRTRNNHSRHVCVFADGEVDRSPTGTGVSARTAILAARNQLEPGQKICIESVIGSTFEVEIAEMTRYGKFEAVIPRVFGNAFVTGRHQFFFDPTDELKKGFFLR